MLTQDGLNVVAVVCVVRDGDDHGAHDHDDDHDEVHDVEDKDDNHANVDLMGVFALTNVHYRMAMEVPTKYSTVNEDEGSKQLEAAAKYLDQVVEFVEYFHRL